MAKDFSLADVKFRETGHIAFADEYQKIREKF